MSKTKRVYLNNSDTGEFLAAGIMTASEVKAYLTKLKDTYEILNQDHLTKDILEIHVQFDMNKKEINRQESVA